MIEHGNPYETPTSEQLLRSLLKDEEYIAVLEYTSAKGMESDNAVLYLVSLLKTFAYAHDQILGTLAKSRNGFHEIAQATQNATSNISYELRSCNELLQNTMKTSTDQIVAEAGKLMITAGEIRQLNASLSHMVREADNVILSLKTLANYPNDKSLASLFSRELANALEKRVPVYDLKFMDFVAASAANKVWPYFMVFQIELAIVVAGYFGLNWLFG